MSTSSPGRQTGFTLIELVITIVVIAIAITGILTIMDRTTASSADPMIRAQAVAIAEGYLEEITLQAFNDPDGSEVGETRANFDDVDDYNALANNGCLAALVPPRPCDQSGAPNNDLLGYTINVSVTPDGTNLNGLTNNQALRIDVSVTHAAAGTITLTGYRACYPAAECP